MDEPSRITPAGVVVVLLLALSAWLLAGWARSQARGSSRADPLTRIRQGGVIRIGYANEAPYGYLDTATGQITGEAPEIARVVLRRLGATRIEPVVTEFGALIPGLRAGRFDVIAAGMYITPARCRQISFSNPTYRIGEALAVRQGNPLDLHSYEDIAADPRARLGVVGGAIEHTYARRVGIPADRLLVFPDNISALTAVRTGRIDACAATSLTIHDLLRKADTNRLQLADPFSDPVIDGATVVGYGAFGFRPQDRQFVAAFDRQLDDFIGTAAHLELTRPFGITGQSLPGRVSARQLCAGQAALARDAAALAGTLDDD
jgi:polar amino acid transport system substrate-binding protein